MCWITRKRDVKFITACKNIAVYKFLLKKDESTYVSPYMCKKYELGKLYTLGVYDFTVLSKWHPFIYDGFHSYSRGCKVTYSESLIDRVYIHPFHYKRTSYTHSLDWYDPFNCRDPFRLKDDPVVIVKCIIPKGSRFCVNEDGEIVSNQIIIDSEIISVEDFINSSVTFKMSSFGEMTTKRQKDAVHFCEEWLKVPFEGDINNFNQVSDYLSEYLEEAKQFATEISCEYQAYIDDLD